MIFPDREMFTNSSKVNRRDVFGKTLTSPGRGERCRSCGAITSSGVVVMVVVLVVVKELVPEVVAEDVSVVVIDVVREDVCEDVTDVVRVVV